VTTPREVTYLQDGVEITCVSQVAEPWSNFKVSPLLILALHHLPRLHRIVAIVVTHALVRVGGIIEAISMISAPILCIIRPVPKTTISTK